MSLKFNSTRSGLALKYHRKNSLEDKTTERLKRVSNYQLNLAKNAKYVKNKIKN